MGSGASISSDDPTNKQSINSNLGSSSMNLSRLRKSLLIRAYNVRNNPGSRHGTSQLTLEDQFRPFSYLKRVNNSAEFIHTSIPQFSVITVQGIKQCLMLDGGGGGDGRDSSSNGVGSWVDDLCKYSLGADSVRILFFG